MDLILKSNHTKFRHTVYVSRKWTWKKTSSKQIEEPTITDVQEVAVDSEEKKPVRKRKITKKSIEPIIEESKNEQEVSLGSTSTDELKVVNANKKQKKEVKSSVPAAAKPQSDFAYSLEYL